MKKGRTQEGMDEIRKKAVAVFVIWKEVGARPRYRVMAKELGVHPSAICRWWANYEAGRPLAQRVVHAAGKPVEGVVKKQEKATHRFRLVDKGQAVPGKGEVAEVAQPSWLQIKQAVIEAFEAKSVVEVLQLENHRLENRNAALQSELDYLRKVDTRTRDEEARYKLALQQQQVNRPLKNGDGHEESSEVKEPVA